MTSTTIQPASHKTNFLQTLTSYRQQLNESASQYQISTYQPARSSYRDAHANKAREFHQTAEGLAVQLRQQPNTDLSKLQIGTLPISNGNFQGTNFSGSTISIQGLGNNLKGANFAGADLKETALRTSNLEGTDFSRANLSTTKSGKTVLLTNSNLSRANFQDSDLRGVDFYIKSDSPNHAPSNLSGANLKNATMGLYKPGQPEQVPPQPTVEFLQQRGVNFATVTNRLHATNFHPDIQQHFPQDTKSSNTNEPRKNKFLFWSTK
jgi:hypothetical protein